MSSTSATTKGLQVDAGSTLIFDATNATGTGTWKCDLTGGNGVTGEINGTLQFEGTGAGTGGAHLDIYTSATNKGNVIVGNGGKIVYQDDTGETDAGAGTLLTFQSGSLFQQQKNGGGIPDAIWNSGSAVKVISAGTVPPVFNGSAYANAEINCSGMTSTLAFNKNISFDNLNLVHTGTGNVAVRSVSGSVPFTLTVNGDLTVSASSKLELAPNTVFDDSSGNIKVKGNIVNNGEIRAHTGADGRFELAGTLNQNISGNGTWFGNKLFFLMNNGAGATLLSPVNMRCYLVFQHGKIRSSSNNMLSMMMVAGDGFAGGWYGGSTTSFVEGPMRRVSDRVAFTFPVGKGNVFAPIAYRNALNYLLTDTFTAEYFRNNPGSVYGTTYDPTGNPEVINHISRVEYWSVMKNPGGLANHRIEPKVMLTSFCSDLNATVVARFDAETNQWKNCNNFGRDLETPGPPYQTGQIYGGSVPIGIGIFTLGSSTAANALADPAQGPLPIRLLAFNATKLTSTKSFITWETAEFSSADEKFEVQRAASDKEFVTIGVLVGSGSSHFYNFTDEDAKTGINYYRLKMTDKDGDVNYSRTVAIMNNAEGLLITSLFPTIVTDRATFTIATTSRQRIDMVITDIQGRVMMRRNFNMVAGNMSVELPMENIGAGAYFLTAVTEDGLMRTIRFIKQ
jgi:hypothetical protein